MRPAFHSIPNQANCADRVQLIMLVISGSKKGRVAAALHEFLGTVRAQTEFRFEEGGV
jgi:hypothetical protein